MRKPKYMKLALIALFIVPVIFMSVTDSNAGEIGSGYLYEGQSELWSWVAPSAEETLTFYAAPGTTFGVEMRGRSNNPLGNWTIPGQRSITLTGGGQFYFLVYSIRGQGNWSVHW